MNSGGKRRGHVSTSFQALVRKRGNIEIEGCVNAVLWVINGRASYLSCCRRDGNITIKHHLPGKSR